MMDRALLIEERNKALKDEGEKKNEGSKWKSTPFGSGHEAGRNRTFITKTKSGAGSSGGGPNDNKTKDGGEAKKQGVRRNLSQDELRELSRKGLCFKCGERWGRDHVCKMKHYRIELVDEDDEGEEGSEEEVAEAEAETGEGSGELGVEFKRLLLSLRSSQGLTSNQSFKVWGLINGRWVLILIDSGASSNFISYQLVKELLLQVEDTAEYTIEVGNGEKLTQKGVCAGLEVEVPSLS